MLREAVILGVLAGCNQIFGLRDTVTQDANAGSLCDPLPFDPHRYAVGADMDHTWDGARTACKTLGMDVAVIDQGDAMEIANQLNTAPTPSWWGISWDGTAWSTVDSCPPELVWAPGYPQPTMPGQCVLQAPQANDGTDGGMQNVSCLDSMWGSNSMLLNFMCETPRPNARCRLQMGERDYVVIPGVAAHDDAAAMCSAMGRHVVEIDSTAELDDLLATVAQTLPSFWVAAVNRGAEWTSPTSCPQVFAWASSEPAGGASCVFYDGAMHARGCNDPTEMYSIICEKNSQ